MGDLEATVGASGATVGDSGAGAMAGVAWGVPGAGEEGSAVEWAAQPVMAMAAANTTAVMILAGRMATSLQGDDPVGLGHQRGVRRSQPGAERVSRQVRNGLDPAAIVDRNDHAAERPERFCLTL